MSYQGTQIGPDGKRRPTGEPDPFVSGVELPVVEDDVVDLAVAFTPPEFLELLGQEPAPEPEPEPDLTSLLAALDRRSAALKG